MIREEWLKSMTTESASGPDLEYDPEFLELVRQSQGSPERQSFTAGGGTVPAAPPDWRAVLQLATRLLDRSRDLRIVHLLTRALTHMQGPAGLHDGLVLCRDLLEQFWDTVHPRLEFDGEPDPVLRVNSITALADRDGLVADLRGARLFESKIGPISVRDIERAIGGTGGAPPQFSVEQLRTAFTDALANAPGLTEPLVQSLEALDRIRMIFVEHLGPEQAPDVSRLRTMLKMLVDFAAAAAPAGITAAELSTDEAPAGASGSADRGALRVAVGDIRSREDAVQMLERVCEFLSRNEPSNPAPLLIRRAQRIMTMPFLDIIRELAPEAMGQVENVAGIKHEGES